MAAMLPAQVAESIQFHLDWSLLFELKAWDPLVLFGAAIGLTIVALAAGFAPAHRAAQIDPMRALRYE
jgi:putative ABC transport system permease protein